MPTLKDPTTNATRWTLRIFGIGVSLVGTWMLWRFGGWQIAAGVFLVLWGDNIDKARRPREPR